MTGQGFCFQQINCFGRLALFIEDKTVVDGVSSLPTIKQTGMSLTPSPSFPLHFISTDTLLH